MTITVETGGPIDTIPTVIGPSASTFSDMALQIADELDDTTGEYSGQIQTAIFNAIRVCEREVYYFNETRDVTFTTVSGQEWYAAADNSNIPTLVRIVAAYCERSDGERTCMNRETPEALELLSDNSASSGEPYAWTYFGQRFRLYPIPDATVYTIRLQLGPYRLAIISNASDSNVWTTEAFDMTKHMAKHIIYRDIIKDDMEATKSLLAYQAEHDALKSETSRRNGSGRIQVTCF